MKGYERNKARYGGLLIAIICRGYDHEEDNHRITYWTSFILLSKR